MKLTLISHFYNEEFLLPYWLSYHSKIFDHGILVNYRSTDDSVQIIRELTPDWEIRESRNYDWDFIDADQELMEIEREIDGWKIILNTTEFILSSDLKTYLIEFEQRNPNLLGVRTNGIVMADKLEDRYKKLGKEHLIFQKSYGYLEADYAPITKANPLHRSRFLHHAPDGQYTLGRHQTQYSSPIDQELFLIWFGFCPFENLKSRKLAFKQRMSERNIVMGAGLQHTWDEEQLEQAFVKESQRSYYLLERIPAYKRVLEEIKDKFNDL
ncbi:MAG: glycosyltransferase family 2 protein [Cyanobacteria bacterium]|jgi:hypothetical protein|nr:glycosyltransferase family 2 protein [Cyanobacteria bacterium GSL.Bin1]